MPTTHGKYRFKLVPISELAIQLCLSSGVGSCIYLISSTKLGRNVSKQEGIPLPMTLAQFSGTHCRVYCTTVGVSTQSQRVPGSTLVVQVYKSAQCQLVSWCGLHTLGAGGARCMCSLAFRGCARFKGGHSKPAVETRARIVGLVGTTPSPVPPFNLFFRLTPAGGN